MLIFFIENISILKPMGDHTKFETDKGWNEQQNIFVDFVRLSRYKTVM